MLQQTSLNQEFAALLDYALEKGASDIHIVGGIAPTIRVDTQLLLMDGPAFTPEKATEIISGFIGPQMYERLTSTRKEQDFSFTYRDLRFRANVFFTRSALSISLRLLPAASRNLEDLGLPAVVSKLIQRNQGLIIIAGPTGHGKSTTLAAMVNQISAERRGHIITIEDPIEYIFEHKKSIVTQREVGSDTPSFASALRSALREDPDVVLVGEMRDLETMEAALQLAETGHLVLTTLHTNSAAQSADRIIDVFPPHQQSQVRTQLSEVLLGIVSQRLLPKVQGGRIIATEIMVANSAVRSLIREGKTYQIPNLIQTSAAEGMASLDKSLAELVNKGEVSVDDALAWSLDPKALKMMIY
ncbi:MAG TPA: PilT/PilU family type 4a pilus ATPase [Verrucomicrobiae bacterium]|nr:PilT/PilU family type 4a pilus ATPase [Verrucomicrobiae bacterium]